jgi:hypothetical protein
MRLDFAPRASFHDSPCRLPTPAPHRAAVVLLAVQAIFLSPAAADTIELNDGREFEGLAIEREDGSVRIETMLGGRKAAVTVTRDMVKSLQRRPLPPGYFEPPPAEARVSDPRKFRQGQTLYLEVPVVGDIGKHVFAQAITSIISYARSHGIPHIVFTIDSEGGDFDEATAIYRALRAAKDDVRCHALIRKCQGTAMVFVFWCKTVHLLPGGVLGGFTGKGNLPVDKDDAEEQEIVLSQIASRVISETGLDGRRAALVRALLVPSEELAAWRGKDDAIETGPQVPEGVAADAVIIKDGKGEVLQLTAEQAVKMGMKPFQGEAKELGAFINIKGWTGESDYAFKTMQRVAAEKEKKSKAKVAAFEEKAKRNTSRREETENFIADNLQQAAAWSPTKDSYQTYAEQWNWGWGWAGSYDSNKWTRESQKKWTTRTDACMAFIREAARGLKSMKKLEAEAAKLNLEPRFKPDEIDAMLRDLEAKYAALQTHREKTGE